MTFTFADLVIKIDEITKRYFLSDVTQMKAVGSSAYAEHTPGKGVSPMSVSRASPLAPLALSIKTIVNDFSDEMIAKRCAEPQRMKLLLASLTREVSAFKLSNQTLIVYVQALAKRAV